MPFQEQLTISLAHVNSFNIREEMILNYRHEVPTNGGTGHF